MLTAVSRAAGAVHLVASAVLLPKGRHGPARPTISSPSRQATTITRTGNWPSRSSGRFWRRIPTSAGQTSASSSSARRCGSWASSSEARRQFQTYIGREPTGKHAAAALFGAAEAAYLAGDYRAAKPDLASFREQYPDDPLNAFALPYLGDIALSSGDVAAAAALLSRRAATVSQRTAARRMPLWARPRAGDAEPVGGGRAALCGGGGQTGQPLGRRRPVPSRRRCNTPRGSTTRR